MRVNISNKKYNWSSYQKLTSGSFPLHCFSPVILNSLSFLTLKHFIIAYEREGGQVNEMVVFVKCTNLNLLLSHLSPPSWSWVFLYLQSSLEFSYFSTCTQNLKHISRLYSLKCVGKDVKFFFLTKHCFYNKRYLQGATRAVQWGKLGKDLFDFLCQRLGEI